MRHALAPLERELKGCRESSRSRSPWRSPHSGKGTRAAAAAPHTDDEKQELRRDVEISYRWLAATFDISSMIASISAPDITDAAAGAAAGNLTAGAPPSSLPVCCQR